jgi:hypothetical protein
MAFLREQHLAQENQENLALEASRQQFLRQNVVRPLKQKNYLHAHGLLSIKIVNTS